ncbi:E3 ubiquitin-protein ligase RNF19A-like [Chelonus insularis]|uniref:E3 ubiquitin-protein ligase RNF19A-like n=1 Tax=Chelonus insularis TaxID=460826 RepID=UPI00158F3EEC|nr:E3 ubiquitin-protein ligase RNF19A-like [Chelonus insularis]
MFKETESSLGVNCNSGPSRPRRHFPRFSLRTLLYSSPLLGRRFIRTAPPSSLSNSRNPKTKNVSAHKQSQQNSDVEKGEAKVLNNPNQRQVERNLEFDRNGSKNESTVIFNVAGKSSETNSDVMECPLCLAELPSEVFPVVQSCHHRSCFDCFQQYLRVEISESRVNIACPECAEPLHPNDIRMILNDQIQLEKYEDFMVRRVLAVEPDARWCPVPDCSYAVIASGCASCPKLHCERPGCDSYFCYHCKARWHPNQTCDAARAQRFHRDQSLSTSFSQIEAATRQNCNDIKPCPRCQVLIVKMEDGSCNHMTCAVCGAEFCWLCMKQISDLHYLSPSGCTFWGKKPWSRKKKILWQLGTLVGAPVGIGLIAGISIPAMIIGIPVWVGRRLYSKYQRTNKHKRNALIVGGVTASIIVSPVLAGLAVGIGVPILLFYVYGVVPVSLCRSGGCGVSTNGSGVRFEFDDENELMIMSVLGNGNGGSGRRNIGDTISFAGGTSTNGADGVSHQSVGNNPSIGEASLGGSGSLLEKLGRENDCESASNIAVASLAGSITSSVLLPNSNISGGQKLKVEADVTVSGQRFSVVSETTSDTTKSLSGKSVNASITGDDGAASTRALAGSVLNFKVEGGNGLISENCKGNAENEPVMMVTSSTSNESTEEIKKNIIEAENEQTENRVKHEDNLSVIRV